VLIVVRPVANWTAYSGPSDLKTGYTYLAEARMVENFEAVQQWGLGVNGTPCLHVYTLSGPSRLVVDVTTSS
jgi:hypothetical protein